MSRSLGVAAGLLLCACAQVHEPGGGERDTQAPRLVDAEPANFSTGFTGDRIVLHFDERVRLDRVQQKLLISPPLDEAPQVRMIGAQAIAIELRSPLAPNTTYTFNVGDAVLDLSENNPASGLAFVISTGDHIDSLRIQGRVVNAFTAAPEKEALVMLYAEGSDSLFRSGSPMYFTRSEEDGSFVLDHLRPGGYQLFALRDQNGDYRYDLPNEDIAFHSGMIDLRDTSTAPIDQHLFREVSATQQLVDARVIPDGALRIVTARPLRSPGLRPVDWAGGSLAWTMELNLGRDTLLAWPSDTTQLRDRIFVLRDDTALIDTLRYLPGERMPFDLVLKLVKRQTDQGTAFQLRASRPIAHNDQQRVRTGPASGTGLPMLVQDASDARLLWIDLSSTAEPVGRIELLPGAVTDIYGGGHDSLRFDLSAPADKETGNLRVRFDRGRSAGPALLQLLTAQGSVLRETAISGTTGLVEWKLLPPGAYGLKMIEDVNANGHWDTGSLDDRRPPELVRRHPDPVSLRSGWDVEVEWTLEDR